MLQAKDEIIIFDVNEYNFKLKFCSCIPFRLLEAILLMILISHLLDLCFSLTFPDNET